jgi:hypothetical protein
MWEEIGGRKSSAYGTEGEEKSEREQTGFGGNLWTKKKINSGDG